MFDAEKINMRKNKIDIKIYETLVIKGKLDGRSSTLTESLRYATQECSVRHKTPCLIIDASHLSVKPNGVGLWIRTVNDITKVFPCQLI